jgi:hypothetical protein
MPPPVRVTARIVGPGSLVPYLPGGLCTKTPEEFAQARSTIAPLADHLVERKTQGTFPFFNESLRPLQMQWTKQVLVTLAWMWALGGEPEPESVNTPIDSSVGGNCSKASLPPSPMVHDVHA